MPSAADSAAASVFGASSRGGRDVPRASQRRTAASDLVLLLIDVINPLQFDGAGQLLRAALPAARALATLKLRLSREGVPAIYVNDNFGCWELGLRELAARLLQEPSRGRPIIELLAPQLGDHLVLKPKHSGFYGT